MNESLHAPVRDHGSGINDCANDDSQKEHVRRKHRKDNRRRKWEAKKLAAESRDASENLGNKFARGADAAGLVYKDLLDFYDSPDPEKPENVKEVYKNIAEKVRIEPQEFQDELAEIAIPESHHKDLPGHGMLIEFCTSENSAIGKVGHQHGVHVICCTEKTLNVENSSARSLALTCLTPYHVNLGLSGNI